MGFSRFLVPRRQILQLIRTGPGAGKSSYPWRRVRQVEKSNQIDQKHVRPGQPTLNPRAALQDLRGVFLQAFKKLPLFIYNLPDAARLVRFNAEPAQLRPFFILEQAHSVVPWLQYGPIEAFHFRSTNPLGWGVCIIFIDFMRRRSIDAN